MSGVAVMVPEFVPLDGDRLSQLALSDAVQSIDPPPVFDTLTVLGGGVGAPGRRTEGQAAGAHRQGPEALRDRRSG